MSTAIPVTGLSGLPCDVLVGMSDSGSALSSERAIGREEMAAGGFIGPYYPGSGTALNSTVCYGRISGVNAAAEEAWS